MRGISPHATTCGPPAGHAQRQQNRNVAFPKAVRCKLIEQSAIVNRQPVLTVPACHVAWICRTVIACAVFLTTWCVHEPLVQLRAYEGLRKTSRSVATNETTNRSECRIIYAGFVGALETSDHKASGVVQIRDMLRGPGYTDVCSNSFLPYTPSAALDWILTYFPSRTVLLTPEDWRSAPKIILVGHSTGGWAVLSVARQLRRRGIPVELTVQVDSVGITDLTIPANVKASAIFHARDILLFLTTKRLKLEDGKQTRLVANVLVKGANHLSITRDPRIGELIVKAIERLRADRMESSKALQE
jgi:hypothetical protein